MNDKIRKRIIFAVFAVTVVWGYFNLFNKPTVTESAEPAMTSVAPVTPSVSAVGLDSVALANLRSSGWGDDPFKKGSAAHFESRPLAHASSPQWNLSGIVYSPSDPLAIINGKMVRVGDYVDDAKVSRIEKKQVIIDYSGSSITLTVNKG